MSETRAMSAQELTEINQIAESLLTENANRIAYSIGLLFDDGSEK